MFLAVPVTISCCIPSSAQVVEELSYTSTPLWATTVPVTGLIYLLYTLLYFVPVVLGRLPWLR